MGMMFKFYKRKFRNCLEPVFVMLIDRKKHLTIEAWDDLVLKITISILKSPEEYLGNDLPAHTMMCDVVYELFEQFMKEKGSDSNAFPLISQQLVDARRTNPEEREPTNQLTR